MLTIIIELILLFVLITAAAYLVYLNLNSIALLTALAAALFVYSFLSSLPFLIKLLFWLALLVAVLIIVAPALRKNLLSGRLLKMFRSALPTMSDTEREALEAGTTWWEAELIFG